MALTRRLKIAIALVAIALLASGCKSAPKGRDGFTFPGPIPAAAQKANRSPIPAGSPFQAKDSRPPVPAPSVGKTDAGCVEAKPVPLLSPLPQDRSWVAAQIDGSGSFGTGCEKMDPGSDCQIPFRGGWKLIGHATGSMVFQVFENGSSTPVRSPELGGIPTAGKFSSATRLFYKISQNAKRATFRVLLKDEVGRVVAQSEPETVTLPACFRDNQ
ncbi:MAG: hypothetical protein ABR507_06265 [Actinomycetota bacterium]|nr:hypothetical protein [Actinomycetota bacterium]